MRWFVRGDVDGFFGLALDNLVQLLLIDQLCRNVLGFPAELVYGRVLPGAAVSLLIGNCFYAWQALRLGRKFGRKDVCALPYGINTVSLFAYVFLVMAPAKRAAEASGAADPAEVAWRAGLFACLGSALIEILGALVAERIRRASPRAALLSTLAGIALAFISLGFLFRTYANPIVGLTTLAIVLLVYFGKVRFRGNVPGGLVAVGLGTLLAHFTLETQPSNDTVQLSLHLPVPVLGDLLQSCTPAFLKDYFSIILPMGIFNVMGSLQNIESAEAAGDSYPTGISLAVNGVGSLAAALFGSCFPTTIYIGHPGWKALGARAGYSILNGAFMTIVCITGTLAAISRVVPIDAAMAIVLWIGIVITAQAFQATERAHAPAVVLGILPGVAAWGALLAKTGLRAAGVGAPGGPGFDEGWIDKFRQFDVWIHGAFALEQGFIFSAMILSAATVQVIERRFGRAAIWCAIGAVLSAAGLIHAYRFEHEDTVLDLTSAWPWAAGYAIMSLVFVAARWITIPHDDGAH